MKSFISTKPRCSNNSLAYCLSTLMLSSEEQEEPAGWGKEQGGTASCTRPPSSARYISSARRATSNLAPSHVPCPPPAARADRAQPPEPHTSPAAHQAGAAQAPDSAPPPQAPAATGSGGLKVTTHALHMSDHCIHLFLRRLARPALNSRAH